MNNTREPFVHQYTVINSSAQSAVVALRDQEGRCHLGRALESPPSAGTQMLGNPPEVGLHYLRLVDTEAPVPVVLVLLDCDPTAAVRLLQDDHYVAPVRARQSAGRV